MATARVTPLSQNHQYRSILTCAVKATWLEEFTKRVPPGWNTLEVVQRIVIPETKAAKCRYVDTVDDHSVGGADYFMSHVWGNKWADTVKRCLEELRRLNQPDRFVWVDIFAVNQHGDSGATLNDLAKLKDVIQMCHRVILCIDEDMSIFSRAWCVYEMFQITKVAEQQAKSDFVLQAGTCGLYGAARGCEYSIIDWVACITKPIWCWCDHVEQCCDAAGCTDIVYTAVKLYVAGAARLTADRIESINVADCKATVAADREKIVEELSSWRPHFAEGLAGKSGLDAVNSNIKAALREAHAAAMSARPST